MNPEVKALWLADLRSGKHKQGTHQLRTLEPDGTLSYCCLGRLTDLAVKAGVIDWDDVPEEFEGEPFESISAMEEPPYAVAQWAGLPEGSFRLVTDAGACEWVSNLNDGPHQGVPGPRQHSFAEIADLIEAQR